LSEHFGTRPENWEACSQLGSARRFVIEIDVMSISRQFLDVKSGSANSDVSNELLVNIAYLPTAFNIQ
jgi:hypothetical protein